MSKAQANAKRLAALAAVEMSIEAKNGQALAESIMLLLEAGHSLEVDDPFTVQPLMVALRGLPEGKDLADGLSNFVARGQIGGAPRVDLVIAAGEAHSQTIRLMSQEPAFVEIRLRKGSDLADIDLQILGPDQKLIVADEGPETGRVGYGNLVEFWPEACVEVTVDITNRGDGDADLVLLIPQSLHTTCDG